MQKPLSVMNDLHKIGEKITEVPDHTAEGPETKRPSALLERRYNDFLRVRNDLAERLTEMETRIADAEKRQTERLESVRNAARTVRELLNGLPEARPDKAAFADRKELSDAMLHLERLRLETIRLAPVIENPEKAVSSASADNQTPILLDSLTFRQIFRIAFIGSLPYVIGLLLMALIISFAVIGSLKGWF